MPRRTHFAASHLSVVAAARTARLYAELSVDASAALPVDAATVPGAAEDGISADSSCDMIGEGGLSQGLSLLPDAEGKEVQHCDSHSVVPHDLLVSLVMAGSTSMFSIFNTKNIYNTSLSFNRIFKRYAHHKFKKFVPQHKPFNDEHLQMIQNFFDNHKAIVIISGAGISTESGIPDYRSEGVGLYATSNRRPVQYKDFLKSGKVRQRYWARNFVGWSQFSSFQPNITHRIIQQWEHHGKVSYVVTQNVDRLHKKAGSQNVIELHGSTYEVKCLSCSYVISRDEFQILLSSLNDYLSLNPKEIRPDGDVDLTQEEVNHFLVPDCPKCSGILKPNIVFFGDNVPRERVEEAKNIVKEADALLALGTSLSVYSAYRFILQATELKIPISIINIGATRGDKHCAFRIPARCGEILPLIRII